jgi:hypothetical protein
MILCLIFVKPHTILLVQQTKSPATRTYMDFASIGPACDGDYVLYIK